MHVTTTVKDRFGVDPDKYLDHGSVVIAAITSCTNTSNPSVMMAAGIAGQESSRKRPDRSAVGEDLARAGLARGHRLLPKAGLLPYLEKLRFNVVGYGCTTCIGNSGPLPADVVGVIDEHGLVAVSVLERQPQLRGPRERGRARELSDESRRWLWLTRSPGGSGTTSKRIRWARTGMASRFT